MTQRRLHVVMMSLFVVTAAMAVFTAALPCPDPTVCILHHSKDVFETDWADVLAELKAGFQPGCSLCEEEKTTPEKHPKTPHTHTHTPFLMLLACGTTRTAEPVLERQSRRRALPAGRLAGGLPEMRHHGRVRSTRQAPGNARVALQGAPLADAGTHARALSPVWRLRGCGVGGL